MLELSQQVYTAPSLSLEFCMIGTHSCQTDVVSMDCVGPCYSSWEWRFGYFKMFVLIYRRSLCERYLQCMHVYSLYFVE